MSLARPPRVGEKLGTEGGENGDQETKSVGQDSELGVVWIVLSTADLLFPGDRRCHPGRQTVPVIPGSAFCQAVVPSTLADIRF